MANEIRLIDANALFYKLVNTDPNTPNRFCDGVAKAMEFILNAPTIDPESLRPKGRWERRDDPEFIMGDFECSVCEYLECDVDTSCLAPGVNCLYYCPNCGAKMEG